MNIKDITSLDWQLSLTEPDSVVQGLDDINQCVLVILTTQQGTDPLRPEFGVDVLSYIDKPTSVAIPNLIRRIKEAIELWEARVTVEQVKATTDVEKISFFVKWKTVDNIQRITEVQYGRTN